jgi:hypothetical protein
MNSYLLSIIGTVLLCALITAIVPEGKTSATVKGIAKVVCTLAIISPILRFFKTGALELFIDKNPQDFFYEDGIEADEDFIQYYSEMRIQQAEEALVGELLEKYGVQCTVKLDWILEEEIRIEGIVVKVLQFVGEEVKEDMRLYLMENHCREVLIE